MTMTYPIDQDLGDDNLLGCDVASVYARFGAPVSCEHDHGILRLMYESPDTHEARGSVELADGVVMSIAGSLSRSRRHANVPASDRQCRPKRRSDHGQEMVGRPVESV